MFDDNIVINKKEFNAKKFLIQNKIKPSYQRIKLLEYLYFKRNHPSVDMIYKDLKPSIPTLSKTTIYNIMNLFIQKDIALSIKLKENEIRFDIKTKSHAHFYCRICNNLYDVEIDNKFFELKEINNNKIESFHIGFVGICKKCRNNYSND